MNYSSPQLHSGLPHNHLEWTRNWKAVEVNQTNQHHMYRTEKVQPVTTGDKITVIDVPQQEQLPVQNSELGGGSAEISMIKIQSSNELVFHTQQKLELTKNNTICKPQKKSDLYVFCHSMHNITSCSYLQGRWKTKTSDLRCNICEGEHDFVNCQLIQIVEIHWV